MNEGIYRDHNKICGFYQQVLGSDDRNIPFGENGMATFHPHCWNPFEQEMMTILRAEIRE